MNEQRAIELCLQHRDPIGFEFLVRKYRREAYFHAVSLMGNREDATDACQESFTRAFRAIHRLKDLEFFYPWFYKILRNCCFNMLSRKKTAAADDIDHTSHSLEFCYRSTPETQMEADEEKQLVWQSIEKLKPEFREILMLKYAHGKNYNQISMVLNIPRGTVMSRLYHARKAFGTLYYDGRQKNKEG